MGCLKLWFDFKQLFGKVFLFVVMQRAGFLTSWKPRKNLTIRLKMDLPTAGEVQWFVVSFELVPDFGFVPVNPASPLARR